MQSKGGSTIGASLSVTPAIAKEYTAEVIFTSTTREAAEEVLDNLAITCEAMGITLIGINFTEVPD